MQVVSTVTRLCKRRDNSQDDDSATKLRLVVLWVRFWKEEKLKGGRWELLGKLYGGLALEHEMDCKADSAELVCGGFGETREQKAREVFGERQSG